MKMLLIFLSCLSQFAFYDKILSQGKFEITGTVPKEYDGATIQITSEDSSFKEMSTEAKHQRFVLAGDIKNQYERVNLHYSSKGEALTRDLRLFISAKKMQVEIDSFAANQIHYINVPFSEEERRYNSYITPANDSAAKAWSLWESASKGKWKNYNIDSLYSVYPPLSKMARMRKVEFIERNLNSYASMYFFKRDLLRSYVIEPDTLFSIYSFFNKNLQGTSLGKSISETIRIKQSLLINHLMPDFSFKTNTGKAFALSSFRNQKNVLICFWASWCGPCVKNIPVLKEIEKNYKTKGLQLISVSVDNDPKNWLKAVEKFSMPWLQTCDLPAYISGSPLSLMYNIRLVPQYFLIDKKGKLIYQNLQSQDDDDDSILQSTLRKILD